MDVVDSIRVNLSHVQQLTFSNKPFCCPSHLPEKYFLRLANEKQWVEQYVID